MNHFRELIFDPFPAAIGVAFCILMLVWRWVRLDHGVLDQLVALERELLRVHTAVRRQLFTEAAFGTSLTLLLVLLAFLVHPGVSAAKWGRILQSSGDAPVAADAFNRGAALATAGTAMIVLLAWSFLVAVSGRHHWLGTLRLLHAPRKHEMRECERRTCRALAYCTNFEALRSGVLLRSGITVRLDSCWYDQFLLAINCHHQELLNERDAQTRRIQVLNRIEAACQSGDTALLRPSRIREAFGGRWVAFLGACLLLATVSATAAAIAGLAFGMS